MAGRLGEVARDARVAAGLTLMDIANRSGQSQSTVSNFEAGQGWRRETDAIVAAYERECGLPQGELWRRALSAPDQE